MVRKAKVPDFSLEELKAIAWALEAHRRIIQGLNNRMTKRQLRDEPDILTRRGLHLAAIDAAQHKALTQIIDLHPLDRS